MTLTVNPWWVIGVLSLALFGVVFLWRVARDAARDLRAWVRRDRVGPLFEDCDHEYTLNEDETYEWCQKCDSVRPLGLPPERSAEALGFSGDARGYPFQKRPPTFLERLEARRERLASAAELEHRAAYEAMGLEFPSGLMARVREAAP